MEKFVHSTKDVEHLLSEGWTLEWFSWFGSRPTDILFKLVKAE